MKQQLYKTIVNVIDTLSKEGVEKKYTDIAIVENISNEVSKAFVIYNDKNLIHEDRDDHYAIAFDMENVHIKCWLLNGKLQRSGNKPVIEVWTNNGIDPNGNQDGKEKPTFEIVGMISEFGDYNVSIWFDKRGTQYKTVLNGQTKFYLDNNVCSEEEWLMRQALE